MEPESFLPLDYRLALAVILVLGFGLLAFGVIFDKNLLVVLGPSLAGAAITIILGYRVYVTTFKSLSTQSNMSEMSASTETPEITVGARRRLPPLRGRLPPLDPNYDNFTASADTLQ